MNEIEIDRLAAAAHELRPDWPVKSLRTMLSGPKLASKPRRDVAVALAWVACETATVKPSRVLEAGPWWKAAAVESSGSSTVLPPRRDQQCLTCGRHLDTCTCGEQRQRREPSAPITAEYAAAKAALAARDHTETEESA